MGTFLSLGLDWIILQKKFYQFRQCISLFCYYFPLKMNVDPVFEQTWIYFTHGCFMQRVVEIGWMVLQKLTIHFYYFPIISFWVRTLSLIWTNLNPLHPRMFVPSLLEIGPVVLEKKKMWKVFSSGELKTSSFKHNTGLN